MASPSAVTLRRNPWARMFGGYWFQTLLAIAVIVQVLLLGVLVAFGVSIDVGALAPSLPGTIIIWGLWLFGIFAAARVDGSGVHTRYFGSRTYAWRDIEQVSFAGRITLGRSAEAVVRLDVGGTEHLIRPLSQCSKAARLEFGEAVIAFARSNGVAVVVDPQQWRWADLSAYPRD